MACHHQKTIFLGLSRADADASRTRSSMAATAISAPNTHENDVLRPDAPAADTTGTQLITHHGHLSAHRQYRHSVGKMKKTVILVNDQREHPSSSIY